MRKRRPFGLLLVLLVMALAAWYTSGGVLPSGPSAPQAPRGWKVPSAAEIERLRAEPGMKVKASELKGMKSASVLRVVDGDTVELSVGGAATKVRLLNVNTPETVDPRRGVEEYGREASNFTKSVLNPGTKVFFKYDVEKEDRYGRQLVHLYLEDGTWFNALLIRAGFAQVATYPPNVSAADYFRELERKARAESIGLWQIPQQKK